MSDTTGPPRAVLDSDVIYSRVLHELFGRLAHQERLLTLIWSEQLLNEARQTLITGKQVSERIADRWVGYLREAFPNERVDIAQVQAEINAAALTNDPEDAHVCALAIAGKADLLITADSGYLRSGLARYGINVTTPDAYLNLALETEPEAVLNALRLQATVWGGGRSIAELLDAIERARASRFADAARIAKDAHGL